MFSCILAQWSAPTYRAWLRGRRSLTKSKLIASAERAAQKIARRDHSAAVLISLHLLSEVSQERVEKVTGMVVSRVAIRELTGARLH